jgi:RNA polymerase sigma factor (TIGR02999 family)
MPGTATGRLGLTWYARKAIVCLIPHLVIRVRAFSPVSELLVRWRAGDMKTFDSLVPLLYKELREIAHDHLRRERPGHTLQSAALVHEAYLRLVDQKPFEAENRAHFLAVASRLMRQILVDYARTHAAAKRGADLRVELDDALVLRKMKRDIHGETRAMAKD